MPPVYSRNSRSPCFLITPKSQRDLREVEIKVDFGKLRKLTSSTSEIWIVTFGGPDGHYVVSGRDGLRLTRACDGLRVTRARDGRDRP